MLKNTFLKKATLFLFIILLSRNAQGTNPVVSWAFSGTILSSNYSLSLNVADSLTLQCYGYSTTAGTKTDGTIPQLLAITKGAPTKYTLTVGTATQQTAFSTDATLVYDNINGNGASYPHWVVMPNLFSSAATFFGKGTLTAYVPYIRTTDAGTYYCSYCDATATYSWSYANIAANTNVCAYTSYFALTVTTKSSQSKGSITNGKRLLEYSALVLGASKILL